MIETLKALHSTWNRLTGQELKYPPCERTLYDLARNDFTDADLQVVLTFILYQNKKREPQYRTRLLFHKICEVEYFNSAAGEANAWMRNRKRPAPPSQQVLETFRRSVEPEADKPARHISEVFKAIQPA